MNNAHPAHQKSAWKRWEVFVIAPLSASLVIALHLMGLLQGLEWSMLDRFFHWRPAELTDPHITVVTIDDNDINLLQHWPISDQNLAEALEKLIALKPRVIALALYRDLPVQPGNERLNRLFRSTPMLIGVEKRFGTSRISAPPALAEVNRVALADVVPDEDGVIRRVLLSANDSSTGKRYYGLSAKAALNYLMSVKIEPQEVNDGTRRVIWGNAMINPFYRYEGAYVRADDGGYQILLNYRGTQKSFATISLTEVLRGTIPTYLVRERIIFIGSIAEGTKDFFPTTYNLNSGGGVAGVFMHAYATSQLVSAAIEGRPLLQGFPLYLTGLWIFTWSWLGVVVLWTLVNQSSKWTCIKIGAGFLLLAVGLVGSSYGLFLYHWWAPVIAPLLALTISTLACIHLSVQRLQQLAYTDGLTQLYNRFFLQQYLARAIMDRGSLSMILCDLDCFKQYNDTYGHQAGDRCLQSVAKAICRTVRSSDVVARYGGEEIAVLLLQTNINVATQVASRILNQIRSLQIPHSASVAGSYLTLSCGVATLTIDTLYEKDHRLLADELIQQADNALYAAKAAGRNCFKVFVLS